MEETENEQTAGPNYPSNTFWQQEVAEFEIDRSNQLELIISFSHAITGKCFGGSTESRLWNLRKRNNDFKAKIASKLIHDYLREGSVGGNWDNTRII